MDTRFETFKVPHFSAYDSITLFSDDALDCRDKGCMDVVPQFRCPFLPNLVPAN